MRVVWRICRKQWQATAFSGVGAAENPGRWNSLGHRAVYCAESRALGLLEILAHAGRKRWLRRAVFVAIPVEVPAELIAETPRLPADWDQKPPGEASRRVGDRFLASGARPVLRVPSVVVPGECNYLVNPLHPRFAALNIGPAKEFRFDERITSDPQ